MVLGGGTCQLVRRPPEHLTKPAVMSPHSGGMGGSTSPGTQPRHHSPFLPPSEGWGLAQMW